MKSTTIWRSHSQGATGRWRVLPPPQWAHIPPPGLELRISLSSPENENKITNKSKNKSVDGSTSQVDALAQALSSVMGAAVPSMVKYATITTPAVGWYGSNHDKVLVQKYVFFTVMVLLLGALVFTHNNTNTKQEPTVCIVNARIPMFRKHLCLVAAPSLPSH